MKAVVLAGNHQEFEDWLLHTDYYPSDVVHVTAREQIVGLETICFIKTGRWWDNDPKLIAEFEFRERLSRRNEADNET
jgi:hypothetical protein